MKDKRILHFDDERNLDHGIIITTAYGLAFWASDDECVAEHVKGFENVTQVRKALKWLQPCKCLRCTSKGELA